MSKPVRTENFVFMVFQVYIYMCMYALYTGFPEPLPSALVPGSMRLLPKQTSQIFTVSHQSALADWKQEKQGSIHMVELGRREAESSAVSQECSRTHPFWRLHALYTGFALPLPSALFVPGSMCLVPKQYRQNLSFTPISTAFLAAGNFCHPPRAGSTCVGISICSIFILIEGSLEVKRPTI